MILPIVYSYQYRFFLKQVRVSALKRISDGFSQSFLFYLGHLCILFHHPSNLPICNYFKTVKCIA